MSPITITAYNHVGIRVKERARSVAFYELLGFREVAWHEGPKVSILRNPAGLEINLIVNASEEHDGSNVLMDATGAKYAGYTHASFRVPSIESTIAALDAAGVRITEGPVELGGVEVAVFVRDPDRNVVELAELLGVRSGG